MFTLRNENNGSEMKLTYVEFFFQFNRELYEGWENYMYFEHGDCEFEEFMENKDNFNIWADSSWKIVSCNKEKDGMELLKREVLI